MRPKPIADAFDALARAGSACEIERLLGSNRVLSRLTWRTLGDCRSNFAQVNATAALVTAIVEKIINGHDAVIALWQHENGFQRNPENPSEALAEIATASKDDERVFLFTSERTAEPVQSKRGEKPPVNITVADRGIGILPSDFPTTIMSLNQSTKITNKLMSGVYGAGGSALYGFSSYTLVYSRSRLDRSVVGFTVVKSDHYEVSPGEAPSKVPVTVYLVDDNGHVPCFQLKALASPQIDPRDVTVRTEDKMAAAAFTRLLATKVVMPENGTVIRSFEVGKAGALSASDKVKLYYQVRERMFGFPVPTRLIMGTIGQPRKGAQEKLSTVFGQRSTYHLKGLRHSLDQERRQKGGNITPLEYSTPAPEPIMYEDGKAQATISVWVIGTKGTDYQAGREPISTVGDITDHSCVFVTLNGQTHARLSIVSHLEREDLEFLRGRLIVEINFDPMNYRQRAFSFTSNREKLKDERHQQVLLALRNFLRLQAQPGEKLREINDDLRRRIVGRGSDEDSAEATKGFFQFMKSDIVGEMLSAFGQSRPNAKKLRPDPMGEWHPEASPQPEPVKPRVLNPIPTSIEMRTRGLHTGPDQWLRVVTDATSDWVEHVRLTKLPEWITLAAPPNSMEGGRVAFNVCVDDEALGRTGEVEAEIDLIGRLGAEYIRAHELPSVLRAPATTITVVGTRAPRTKHDRPHGAKRSPAQQPGIPEAKVTMVSNGRDAEQFISLLQPGGLPDDSVAGRYRLHQPPEGGNVIKSIDVFLNEDFPPLARLKQAIEKDGGQRAADAVEKLYKFGAVCYALSQHQQTKAQDENLVSINQEQERHLAFALAMDTAARLLWLQRRELTQRPPKQRTSSDGHADEPVLDEDAA